MGDLEANLRAYVSWETFVSMSGATLRDRPKD